jgi:hypothetical protein
MPDNDSEYKQRVVDERMALNDKIDRLAAFVKTPVFTDMDDEDRSLLTQQLRTMRNYLDILDDRITRFQ